jgi:mono/diheme cytochrome c family protein
MKRALLFSLVAGGLLAVPAQAADKKIERTFNSKCGSCHGKDGKGQTEKGKKMAVRDMTTEDYQKGTDADWRKVIEDGMKKDEKGVKQEMDGYKSELKPEEIDGLIQRIREFKK